MKYATVFICNIINSDVFLVIINNFEEYFVIRSGVISLLTFFQFVQQFPKLYLGSLYRITLERLTFEILR